MLTVFRQTSTLHVGLLMGAEAVEYTYASNNKNLRPAAFTTDRFFDLAQRVQTASAQQVTVELLVQATLCRGVRWD